MDAEEHREVEESSSKRRERLLALRTAANASPAAAAPPPTASPSLLPDPDLAGDRKAADPRARQPHRFDYYTNPAAAFSSSSGGGGGSNPTYPHKRKSPPACYAPRPAPPPPQPYAGPWNSGNNYPPPNQQHMASSPVHHPFQMQHDARGRGSSPWRSPMQFQDPTSGYQGIRPGATPWGPHSGPAGQGSYSNPSSFGFRHPNPGRGVSPMNYGPRGSPHAYYVRGRGQNYNNSPGTWGRGGRGGVGFPNHPGQDRRIHFNKSMVEDPWQGLQPIVGNILIPRGSESWLPESLREKRETPARDGQINKPASSGLSLAEYLDLSFNEACCKET